MIEAQSYNSVGSQTVLLSGVTSGPAPSEGTTRPTPVCDVVLLRDQPSAEEAFRRHLESLPTLDDLEAELKEGDPELERRLADARERRRAELLVDVESGKITRVYAERLLHGMSQRELAERLGTQQPSVSRMERAGHAVSKPTAMALGDIFGIDYREFL